MDATEEKMWAVLEEICSAVNSDMDSGRGNTGMVCGFTDMEARKDDGFPEATCFMNCGMAACLREMPKDIAADMEKEYDAQRLEWAGEFVKTWNGKNPGEKLDENDPVSAIFDAWIGSCNDPKLENERLDEADDSFCEWMNRGQDTDVMLAFRFSEDDDNITLSMIVNREKDVFSSFGDEVCDHLTFAREDFLKAHPEAIVDGICFDRRHEQQTTAPGVGN